MRFQTYHIINILSEAAGTGVGIVEDGDGAPINDERGFRGLPMFVAAVVEGLVTNIL